MDILTIRAALDLAFGAGDEDLAFAPDAPTERSVVRWTRTTGEVMHGFTLYIDPDIGRLFYDNLTNGDEEEITGGNAAALARVAQLIRGEV